MRLKPVDSKKKVSLRDADARPPRNAPSGDKLKTMIDEQTERIANLQRVFYGDARYAMLIVLQGRDASGKDGTIRHVFSAVNPQACEVTSFKVPTDAERHHDFLWRIHQRVPARGVIGIFNRSHYEDVLVDRAHGTMSKRVCAERYDQINDFERMLSDNGVVILKFFLHVSRDEQRRRLEDRLTDETKNWKFRVGDLDDRSLWKPYTSAYRDALEACSKRHAPWYVVPADDKDVRNLLVARTIADTLDGLGLRYPEASAAVRALEIK
ncbi:MAG TPA: PPK2 family polyphosphate kinase [Gemmatimonadaceae bacterium]